MSCNGINRSTMKETKRNKSKLAKATSIKGRNNCRITIKSNGQVGETWGANAVAYLLFGLVVAICMGYVYSVHSKLLHENELWFSQISVSFTECQMQVCIYAMALFNLSAFAEGINLVYIIGKCTINNFVHVWIIFAGPGTRDLFPHRGWVVLFLLQAAGSCTNSKSRYMCLVSCPCREGVWRVL